MAAYDAFPDDEGGLAALMEDASYVRVHTSVAAETAFLAGLVALLSAPFSLTLAVAIGCGAIALVLAVVGLAATSRPAVAGGALNAVGLLFALVALTLVAVRYLGIDTAFGDEYVPQLSDRLRSLNDLLPPP